LRTLDIGAHWLHQSVLWTQAGFKVTAVDMPITFDMPHVKSIADRFGIKLNPTSDLEASIEFDDFPDSSFDVILFTEIFEHLTFNPVRFWKQVHRVLSPGGRIVLTTPNYYAWNGRAWDTRRFLGGFGGGISVDDILNTNTHAHHWREFSLHEVIRYFCILSPDFNTVKAKRVRNYYPKSSRLGSKLGHIFLETIPALRPNLHLEIEITSKKHGIVVKPSW
jgi:2-polyprenyl-6-hydroxyphenyl methylase/3-demethylubiquinone-9 3-methyltransferase